MAQPEKQMSADDRVEPDAFMDASVRKSDLRGFFNELRDHNMEQAERQAERYTIMLNAKSAEWDAKVSRRHEALDKRTDALAKAQEALASMQ